MIEMDNVSLKRGSFRLDKLSLCFGQPGIHLLIGETGVGKTSVVEAICGLQPVASGQVKLRGENVTGVSPAARSIGYLPQDVALFDHLSVRENLGFACAARKWSPASTRERVNSLSASLGISDLLQRFPEQLSGGQKHCVALGRALAFDPDIVCLDEPFAALDGATRDSMIQWFINYVDEHEVTVLAVTHQPQWLQAVAKTQLKLDNPVVSPGT